MLRVLACSDSSLHQRMADFQTSTRRFEASQLARETARQLRGTKFWTSHNGTRDQSYIARRKGEELDANRYVKTSTAADVRKASPRFTVSVDNGANGVYFRFPTNRSELTALSIDIASRSRASCIATLTLGSWTRDRLPIQ